MLAAVAERRLRVHILLARSDSPETSAPSPFVILDISI